MCRRRPGKERDEGRLAFMNPDFDDSDTIAILESPEWAPDGKAGVVRTIELLDSILDDNGGDWDKAFNLLADAD